MGKNGPINEESPLGPRGVPYSEGIQVSHTLGESGGPAQFTASHLESERRSIDPHDTKPLFVGRAETDLVHRVDDGSRLLGEKYCKLNTSAIFWTISWIRFFLRLEAARSGDIQLRICNQEMWY
jgi:hypothetical protein